MSKIKEWVDSATDQEIVTVLNESNHRQGMALFGCLMYAEGTAADELRLVNIHRRTGSRLYDWLSSDEWKAYHNHEEMLPEYAKAEFVPASAAPEVGSLRGEALCIDNEEPAFPTYLKDGQLKPVLNYDFSQYQWAPTAEEATKSKHYELGNYDAHMPSEARKDRTESRRDVHTLSKAWQKRIKGEV